MFRRALVSALCLISISACGSADHRSSSSTASPASTVSHDLTANESNPQLELARKFAPILKMHPQELYLPMDPEDFFVRNASERDEEFFLSSRSAYLQGHQGRTIVNVSEDSRRIQYWIFTPKNGCQGAKVRYRMQGPIKIGDLGETTRALELCNISIHQGDWENITLELSNDRSRVESAYLSAHGHGNWLPASALEFRGERPYFYQALNSHAFYAKDIGFHADTTITHAMLNGLLGVEWFQIGDIISGEAYVQKNPSDGQKVIEFDTGVALWSYDSIDNEAMKAFQGAWGVQVNAKEVLSLPELSQGPIEGIIKVALNVALKMVPELKDRSNGQSPPSPWGRSEWRTFDGQYAVTSGLTFDPSFGGEGGQAFGDYEVLRRSDNFHVRQIRIRSGDRIDRVCIVLDETGELCHGGDGGKEKSLVLGEGEYVTNVGMASGKRLSATRIFAIKFTTNWGRTLEGGTWTDTTVWQEAPRGMQLVGWYGGSGTEVDSLGPIYGTLRH